ncbi:hypothetical protein I8D64_11620 [Brachybacterium sp. MASK1Z-5]|uniref:DNA-directed DNA polymerase n=1 Tax=Brachybacterium halotolerans TaxID=2795215 RepID=A0ABS1BC22_9MICO|nr:hypothetical protein [Brachybacterium halotolerans]MBK0332047.1 hypothetical protein [Brachybacterium halotolerans]
MFGELESVRAMRPGKSSILIGFDTEFKTDCDTRTIMSWQFVTPDVSDPTLMVEVVIVPQCDGDRISMVTALWEVVVAAELWRSPLVKDSVTARGVHKRAFWDADRDKRRKELAKHRVPVTLVCHYAQADLTTFRDDRRLPLEDPLSNLTAAAGGLVTLRPFRLQRSDANGRWWRSMAVVVRDCMALAPAGKKKLKILGDACGVPKIDLPEGAIENMDDYRASDFTSFLEYGINDAVICLEFLAPIWGEGMDPPATLGGGAAKALVSIGQKYFGAPDSAAFRKEFSGLVKENQAVEIIEKSDKLAFYEKRGLAPLDGPAGIFMYASAQAYHGGLNSCPTPGYYTSRTEDIDVQNAYPTAMGMVVDLDWEAGVLGGAPVVQDRELTLDDVPSTTTPFVGWVNFSFPEDIAFPCIPILHDNTLIYARTSDGTGGTWAAAPELWLALKLGATVTCSMGYTGRARVHPDGTPSRSLREGVALLIADRRRARAEFGKGSLEEQTLKEAVNAIYGKLAQDVTEHRGWNAWAQEMDEIGGSSITSPYHAAMTTSIVRALLNATMNQVVDSGHQVFSVTTDGFITDMTASEVEQFDLYGMAAEVRESRLAMTGHPSIWESKGIQQDLLNFTTRGNVSSTLGGVCAHNGLKVPQGIVEDSAEDREYLMRVVATREGRVRNPYKVFPSFQELSSRDARKDFVPTVVKRAVSMDYDLKRRPVMDSMRPERVALPDGTKWEIASFETAPWETVEDARRAREIARDIAKTSCLRTVDQWDGWYLRFAHGKGRRIVTPHRAVLMSILMAHRQGVITIPALADGSLTVSERLEWLESWGLGTVTEGDWKNARRPERVAQMLPLSALEPHLSNMLSAPAATTRTDTNYEPEEY